MRILHVTFMYPTPAKPLNGVAVEALVNGISRHINDSEQTVLHLTNLFAENVEGTFLPERRIEYYRLKTPPYYKFLPFFGSSKINTFLKVEDFDIVHFHNFFPGVFLLEDFLDKNKLPYVITFRGSCLRAIQYIYRKGKMKKLIGNACQFIFPSEYFYTKISGELQKLNFNFPDNKVHFIPNFKTNDWADGSNKKYIGATFKLLLIANIEQRKNIINTINAVKRVAGKTPVTLDIYGDVYDEALMDEIKKISFDFESFIKYYPSVSNDEMKTVIDKHDALILLAHKETFGIAYIESILRQRPVIYSASAGIASFIKNDNYGVRVQDENNIEEIAFGIIQCIEKYNTFDFTNREKFLEDEVMKQWEEIYKNVDVTKVSG